MSHDQLSKSLITTFFCQFLRLAAPDSAPRLRPSEATFMDKEFFLDWPAGNRRELDLLAKVPVAVNWLKTCVKLSGESAAEFERLLALEENKEIRTMETTWLGKAEAKGVKKGEAKAVEKLRQAVLQGLEQRFGAVPQRVRRRIEAIRSLERLAELVAAISSPRAEPHHLRRLEASPPLVLRGQRLPASSRRAPSIRTPPAPQGQSVLLGRRLATPARTPRKPRGQ